MHKRLEADRASAGAAFFWRGFRDPSSNCNGVPDSRTTAMPTAMVSDERAWDAIWYLWVAQHPDTAAAILWEDWPESCQIYFWSTPRQAPPYDTLLCIFQAVTTLRHEKAGTAERIPCHYGTDLLSPTLCTPTFSHLCVFLTIPGIPFHARTVRNPTLVDCKPRKALVTGKGQESYLG